MFHYGVHTERTNDLTLFAFALSNVLAQACFNLCLGHDNFSQQMPKNIYHIIVDAAAVIVADMSHLGMSDAMPCFFLYYLFCAFCISCSQPALCQKVANKTFALIALRYLKTQGDDLGPRGSQVRSAKLRTTPPFAQELVSSVNALPGCVIRASPMGARQRIVSVGI